MRRADRDSDRRVLALRTRDGDVEPRGGDVVPRDLRGAPRAEGVTPHAQAHGARRGRSARWLARPCVRPLDRAPRVPEGRPGGGAPAGGRGGLLRPRHRSRAGVRAPVSGPDDVGQCRPDRRAGGPAAAAAAERRPVACDADPVHGERRDPGRRGASVPHRSRSSDVPRAHGRLRGPDACRGALPGIARAVPSRKGRASAGDDVRGSRGGVEAMSTGPPIDTRALGAVLFVSDEPLTPAVLSQALEVDRRTVDDLCAGLQNELAERGSGLVLRNVAGGWRLFTDPETQPVVERFVLSSRQARMTKAALETLAIVAYKQPVTRHQVSAIRGVNADGVLRALVDRGLVEEAGRDEGPGRPLLYATTPMFLERLGLASLAALPSLAPLLDASAEPAGARELAADHDKAEARDEPNDVEPGGERGNVDADDAQAGGEPDAEQGDQRDDADESESDPLEG